MSAAGSLEYAQARLSARYGARPGEAAWRRIEHVRALPALLDAVRATSLHRWTGGIEANSTPHEIDRIVRGHWRELVAEVASWMPAEWQAAVGWCGVLFDLPLLRHLAAGGDAPAWLRADRFYAEAFVHAAARQDAVSRSPIAPLAAAWNEPDRIGELWLAHWRRTLPRTRGAERASIDALVRALGAHRAAFREPGLVNGWPLRRALQARLALLYRRAVLEPAAAFVYLALAALDAERLRGELARRAAFPSMPLAA